MNSPKAKIFDLSDEPKRTTDYYNTGPFGLGCLLARRLVEAGARFIEVHTPYKPFGHWDTHEDGHSRTVELKKMIDRPVAQLDPRFAGTRLAQPHTGGAGQRIQPRCFDRR